MIGLRIAQAARRSIGEALAVRRVNQRGRTISRRCFIASERKLILPAFGALTGGLDAAHPEIIRAVGPNAQALVPLSDRLLRFPLAA